MFVIDAPCKHEDGHKKFGTNVDLKDAGNMYETLAVSRQL